MNRVNSSRQTISSKQRNSNYRPSNAIAQHVLDTTVEIDSTEKVVEINGSFWVASKFAKRYYRVVVENDKWFCSARDERVAASCKASVQAYQIRQPKGVLVWTQKPVYCNESNDPFINPALR